MLIDVVFNDRLDKLLHQPQPRRDAEFMLSSREPRFL